MIRFVPSTAANLENRPIIRLPIEVAVFITCRLKSLTH